MHIPYSIEARPDTGVTNGKLAVWLFLASEVMLFGALFSSYVILRAGADGWPRGLLNVPAASFNTLVLISSSFAMVKAVTAARAGRWEQQRRYLAATWGLGLLFLVVKGVEYAEHLSRGEYAANHTFWALYYTLTGFHAAHILGGLIVIGYFLGTGARSHSESPKQLANRIENTSLYWQFVDVVWLCLFPMLYLF